MVKIEQKLVQKKRPTVLIWSFSVDQILKGHLVWLQRSNVTLSQIRGKLWLLTSKEPRRSNCCWVRPQSTGPGQMWPRRHGQNIYLPNHYESWMYHKKSSSFVLQINDHISKKGWSLCPILSFSANN